MTLENFDEMLNESYDVVKIAGIEFSPADILKNCDPTGYDVYAADWLSFEEE